MQTSVMRAHQWSRVFLLLLVSLIFNTNVSASTVKQVSFDELIEQSELVFEGNVVSAESRWNNSKTLIKTFITFEITEVIFDKVYLSQFFSKFWIVIISFLLLQLSSMFKRSKISISRAMQIEFKVLTDAMFTPRSTRLIKSVLMLDFSAKQA